MAFELTDTRLADGNQPSDSLRRDALDYTQISDTLLRQIEPSKIDFPDIPGYGTAPTPVAVAQSLAKELGNPRYAVRENASLKLSGIFQDKFTDGADVSELMKLAHHRDPEVAARVYTALKEVWKRSIAFGDYDTLNGIFSHPDKDVQKWGMSQLKKSANGDPESLFTLAGAADAAGNKELLANVASIAADKKPVFEELLRATALAGFERNGEFWRSLKQLNPTDASTESNQTRITKALLAAADKLVKNADDVAASPRGRLAAAMFAGSERRGDSLSERVANVAYEARLAAAWGLVDKVKGSGLNAADADRLTEQAVAYLKEMADRSPHFQKDDGYASLYDRIQDVSDQESFAARMPARYAPVRTRAIP